MPTVVGDVINLLMSYWWLWIGIFLVIVILKYFYRPETKDKFDDFEPQPIKVTAKEGLKKRFDVRGIRPKGGDLFIGFHRIAGISRYYKAKGNIDIGDFDPKTSKITYSNDDNDETERPYDLLFIETNNNFILFRILGIKKGYFILKVKGENGDNIVTFNPYKESVIINPDSNIIPYADVFTNCYAGIEVINDISMARLNEQLQMHLENNPDKYVHLEMQQAKLERRVRVMTDLEKSKYKEREEAGDTTVV